MKILTYGFDDIHMDVVRWNFGENEYVDVTDSYQDIFACKSDVVVISEENCSQEILAEIQGYEQEKKLEESREYVYVTDALSDRWAKEMYGSLRDISKTLYREMSDEQVRAMGFVTMHTVRDGYITGIRHDPDRKVTFLDVFRPEHGRTELVILSDGDDPISKEECDRYMATGRYDMVGVDWIREEQGHDNCLETLLYTDLRIADVPPVLRPVAEKFYAMTERHHYALYGE